MRPIEHMEGRLISRIARCLVLVWAFNTVQLVAQDSGRIQLQLDASEAEAVLSILNRQAAGTAPTDDDWKQLFVTEPYVRLKKREASMKRDFTDDDFKKFVLSPELAAKATALRHRNWSTAKILHNHCFLRVLTSIFKSRHQEQIREPPM